MITPGNFPETLSLFPLPGALLLPRSRLPLNIFEPRYLAMFEDALKTSHRMIGMIQPLPEGAVGDPPRLHSIGCAGRIVAFSETEDNRYMITLGGVSRFRIGKVIEGFEPYLRADISWEGFSADVGKVIKDKAFKREEFLGRLGQFFKATGLSSDWESLEHAEDELLINSLSMMLPFGIEDKQALLEAPTLTDRRETLVTLIEFAMRSGGDEGKLQ